MEVLALKMKNNIKELRKARWPAAGRDMAKLLGVSRQTIVAMENDKYDLTLELAIKTARLWNSQWRVYSSSMKNREN